MQLAPSMCTRRVLAAGRPRHALGALAAVISINSFRFSSSDTTSGAAPRPPVASPSSSEPISKSWFQRKQQQQQHPSTKDNQTVNMGISHYNNRKVKLSPLPDSNPTSSVEPGIGTAGPKIKTNLRTVGNYSSVFTAELSVKLDAQPTSGPAKLASDMDWCKVCMMTVKKRFWADHLASKRHNSSLFHKSMAAEGMSQIPPKGRLIRTGMIWCGICSLEVATDKFTEHINETRHKTRRAAYSESGYDSTDLIRMTTEPPKLQIKKSKLKVD